MIGGGARCVDDGLSFLTPIGGRLPAETRRSHFGNVQSNHLRSTRGKPKESARAPRESVDFISARAAGRHDLKHRKRLIHSPSGASTGSPQE